MQISFHLIFSFKLALYLKTLYLDKIRKYMILFINYKFYSIMWNY